MLRLQNVESIVGATLSIDGGGILRFSFFKKLFRHISPVQLIVSMLFIALLAAVFVLGLDMIDMRRQLKIVRSIGTQTADF